MKIFIANLGSTSFKYKLFDMSNGEVPYAVGSADRIGLPNGTWSLSSGSSGSAMTGEAQFKSHGDAIDFHLQLLQSESVISGLADIEAIGFKAVHGGPISGAVVVDDRVLGIMEEFSDVAPLHNPPYISAMKALQKLLPDTVQVAVFETSFHQSIPEKRQVYAIPHEWTEKLGIRRYGFHGASHGYIGSRMKEIDDTLARVISCHLGGSSSICAIEAGRSVANSFGMTAQTGIPHAVRVGDFDPFSMLKLEAAGIDREVIWQKLGKESGLLGMSGISGDLRDIEQAAEDGNERALLTIDVLVESIRFYVGAYLTVLGGADALCFTGGIGQHSSIIRRKVVEGLDYAGVILDQGKNQKADGRLENRIDAPAGQVQIWILPTNEELIVARQVMHVLNKK